MADIESAGASLTLPVDPVENLAGRYSHSTEVVDVRQITPSPVSIAIIVFRFRLITRLVLMANCQTNEKARLVVRTQQFRLLRGGGWTLAACCTAPIVADLDGR